MRIKRWQVATDRPRTAPRAAKSSPVSVLSLFIFNFRTVAFQDRILVTSVAQRPQPTASSICKLRHAVWSASLPSRAHSIAEARLLQHTSRRRLVSWHLAALLKRTQLMVTRGTGSRHGQISLLTFHNLYDFIFMHESQASGSTVTYFVYHSP